MPPAPEPPAETAKTLQAPTKPTTTQEVQQEHTFEIPDFSEEDLDFDLGLEEFTPDKKPITLPKPASDITPELQPNLQIEDEEDLPAFEVSSSLDLMRELAESQPKKKLKQKPKQAPIDNKGIDVSQVFSDETAHKIEVFIEKNNYKVLLMEEDKIQQTIKDSQARANSMITFFRYEDEAYDSVAKSMIDVQRKLAMLDMKIFGKGDQ